MSPSKVEIIEQKYLKPPRVSSVQRSCSPSYCLSKHEETLLQHNFSDPWSGLLKSSVSVWVGCSPSTTVTTRSITWKVEDPYKPPLATVAGRGSIRKCMIRLRGQQTSLASLELACMYCICFVYIYICAMYINIRYKNHTHVHNIHIHIPQSWSKWTLITSWYGGIPPIILRSCHGFQNIFEPGAPGAHLQGGGGMSGPGIIIGSMAL